MRAIDLSIVIVNFNTRQLTLDCIESIWRQVGDLAVEVIVVDNASTDGSADAIRQQFPSVTLIANPRNSYFSEGNNIGIRAATGEYILALNPDMLLKGAALPQLIAYMDSHPDVGAATTTMYFPDGTLQRNGSHNVTFEYLVYQYTLIGKLRRSRLKKLNDWLWYRDWDRKSEREVGVLPGSAIIARRTLWSVIGGFQAEMLMYFSDDYLSLAVRKAGKKTVFVPTDGIIHYENASTRQVSRRALNLYFRDLLVYTRLVFGRLAQWALGLLLLPTWFVQFLKAR